MNQGTEKGSGDSNGAARGSLAVLVLGIETSCDETGVALVEDGRRVRSNVLADQQTLHARYGGVVPEVASRAHVDLLHPAVEEACALGGARLGDVDAVAVTLGPGLAGSLLVGVAAAKAYAFALDRPLLGVNHLIAHVYANVLEHGPLPLPAVVFVVSGGHTSLLVMDGQGAFRVLGQTIDDAAGEAYDKVARVLGLGYPGGPVIDDLARTGDPAAVRFPRALIDDGSDDFSLSGLKTAVLRHVRAAGPALDLAGVAASFQEAVVDVQVSKVLGAAKREGLDTVLLAGGVAANSRLRARLTDEAEGLGVRVLAPSPALCTDNGAMVACAGSLALERGERTPLEAGADPNLPIVPGVGRRAPRRPKRQPR
jgi:N6-L-threonylcarbamoyladenine synthase